MHAHHQYVFVVAAVENHDLAGARRLPMDTPEKVVRQLHRRRNFEGSHLDALRIDAVKHVANDAILACSVHPLQNNQHFVFAFGIEQLLQRL